jgi:hypothetical protein
MKPNVHGTLATGLGIALISGLPLLTGCSQPAHSDALQVTYYYHPGCSVCERARPVVGALENEFSGKVTARAVDATSPEGSRAVESLGLDRHGLVIRSPRGFVLWKQPGRDVDLQEVREELHNLVGSRRASA